MAALEGSSKATQGLAKRIRESTESEQFDLAGYDQAQTEALIRSAFSEPLSVPEMLRFTFVVGGGSKVRQKYDANLTKFLSAVLREIGFEQDRAASATLDCQGSFKQQHDTDKNLIFMHVFPRVEIQSMASGGGGGGEAAERSLSDLGSPAYLATVCSTDTFQKMVESKTQSWAQRRRLLTEMNEMVNRFTGIEEKMMRAQTLEPEEAELYELTSTDDIQEKITLLNGILKGMVEGGQLTMGEKQQLLEQVTDKIEAVETELALAESDGKPKRAEKLKVAQGNLNKRRDMLQSVVPIRHPLKHEAEIMELWEQIIPLDKLIDVKGRLLTMEENKRLGMKPELEEKVVALEVQSRGWFEEDADFGARCAALKAAATRVVAKNAKAAAAKAKKAQAEANTWQTVGSMGSGKSNYGRAKGAGRR